MVSFLGAVVRRYRVRVVESLYCPAVILPGVILVQRQRTPQLTRLLVSLVLSLTKHTL